MTCLVDFFSSLSTGTQVEVFRPNLLLTDGIVQTVSKCPIYITYVELSFKPRKPPDFSLVPSTMPSNIGL